MRERRTHLVFTPSAGHALRQALARATSADEILCLRDDLSLGPIGRASADRRAWMERTLAPYPHGAFDEGGAFVAAVAAAARPLVAWLSVRESGAYASFLWWLARAGSVEVLLGDAAVLRTGDPAEAIAACRRAVPLTADRRLRWERRWRDLEAQNAPLRVIDGQDLVSAGIDHFDADLLGCATRRWRRMARIVGDMFGGFERTGCYQAGDAVLAARLAALARDGRLEARGNLADMADCELRLPSA